MMLATGGVESYYGRAFGRAPALGWGSPGDPSPVEPESTGALFMQMALMIDSLRGSVYLAGGSLGALTLAGYSLWVLQRDWRYRPYYILGLLAGVAGLRRYRAPSDVIPQDPPPSRPPFDLAGHVVLPIALAGGALSDVWLRGSGLPSFLALALAMCQGAQAAEDDGLTTLAAPSAKSPGTLGVR